MNGQMERAQELIRDLDEDRVWDKVCQPMPHGGYLISRAQFAISGDGAFLLRRSP